MTACIDPEDMRGIARSRPRRQARGRRSAQAWDSTLAPLRLWSTSFFIGRASGSSMPMRSPSSLVDPRRLPPARGPVILTPHPGEAARLLGKKSEDVERDRAGAVSELADRARATVVLKGARTIVASSEGPLLINTSGNPALATAGAGDVLAGIIAAFACVMSPEHAASAGVARPRAGRRLVASSPWRGRSRPARQRGCRWGARGHCRTGTRADPLYSLTRRCVSSAAADGSRFPRLAIVPDMAPDLRKRWSGGPR